MNHILLIKFGALGDVVRTAYFANALKEKYRNAVRISWLTDDSSTPLIRFNDAVDDIWTKFSEAESYLFDCVYSLDDEFSILNQIRSLRFIRLVGAYVKVDGSLAYTDDSAEWFDMGLLSIHGIEVANQLKKNNEKSHGEIFSKIFGVDAPRRGFYGSRRYEELFAERLSPFSRVVGINWSAGARWRSKELQKPELVPLVTYFLTADQYAQGDQAIVLLGGLETSEVNNSLCSNLREQFKTENVLVFDTNASLLLFAALIKNLDFLVSSDSLAMHLAIAQGVKTLAFFGPTSAAEIDDFGQCIKLVASDPDYCSYKPDCDVSSITAASIIATYVDNFPQIAMSSSS